MDRRASSLLPPSSSPTKQQQQQPVVQPARPRARHLEQEPWFANDEALDLQDESSRHTVLGIGLLSLISAIFTLASLLWTLYAVIYYGWWIERPQQHQQSSFSFLQNSTFSFLFSN